MKHGSTKAILDLTPVDSQLSAISEQDLAEACIADGSAFLSQFFVDPQGCIGDLRQTANKTDLKHLKAHLNSLRRHLPNEVDVYGGVALEQKKKSIPHYVFLNKDIVSSAWKTFDGIETKDTYHIGKIYSASRIPKRYAFAIRTVGDSYVHFEFNSLMDFQDDANRIAEHFGIGGHIAIKATTTFFPGKTSKNTVESFELLDDFDMRAQMFKAKQRLHKDCYGYIDDLTQAYKEVFLPTIEQKDSVIVSVDEAESLLEIEWLNRTDVITLSISTKLSSIATLYMHSAAPALFDATYEEHNVPTVGDLSTFWQSVLEHIQRYLGKSQRAT
jgi:hypothetical protein